MGKLRIALVLAALVLLALVERWVGPRVAAGRLETGAAQWIWAGLDETRKTPRAFFAARDFELSEVPAEAELLILGDEEYIAELNGTRVGSNRYLPGAGLDRYPVAELLVPGSNRLLVELRSGRRAGGLLARLRGDGGLDLVSGPDWSILMRHRGSHQERGTALVRPYPPRLWGPPPTGRWRLPQAGPPRALFAEVHAPRRRLLPERLRTADHPQWRPAPPPRPGADLLGQVVTFDFGSEVSGYLGLVFGTRLWPRALLYTGAEPPDPDHGPPAGFAFGPRGRLAWEDSVPRRLRYVTVLSPGGLRGAYLLPADPELAPPFDPTELRRRGVFGVAEPPQLVTPVEDEIRRELQSPPRLAVGEAG